MSEPNAADSAQNRLLWGASQLFLLGLVSRFHRNYRRFNRADSSIADPVDRNTLLELTRIILYKQRVYLNLFEKDGYDSDIHYQLSALLLRQQIIDHLDDLHVRLLEHDPEQIAPLIPELDMQRKFWELGDEPFPMNTFIEHYNKAHSSFNHWRDELRSGL